jgi:hypothetical protein
MLEHIVKRFKEWEHLGTKVAKDGSRLIVHTPRDYPEAYLHRFFGPVSESAWTSYGLKIPGQLQALYRECNGFSIFGGTLEVYGIRAHFKRDDSAQFQPFDLASHHAECIHVHHRGSAAELEEGIFFGSYDYDGSHFFATPFSPEVHRVLRGGKTVVNTWPDLKTFLTSEYDRIDPLFSREGYLIDEDLDTTPAPMNAAKKKGK